MVEKADPENVGASVHARAGPGKPPGFVPAAPHSLAPLGLRRRGGLLPTRRGLHACAASRPSGKL